MHADSLIELEEQLAALADGRQTLDAFQRWFAPIALAAESDSSDPLLTDLVYDVELRLAEYAHGDWTQGDVRNLFAELLKARRGSAARPSTAG
jgi:hypothetical protein